MSTSSESRSPEEARSKLVARRKLIDRSQRNNDTDGAQLLGDGPRERASNGDLAGVLATLSDRERKEVDAIDAALLRIDKGTWGHCASCRAKIATSRLTAMPEADTCLDCATAADAARN